MPFCSIWDSICISSLNGFVVFSYFATMTGFVTSKWSFFLMLLLPSDLKIEGQSCGMCHMLWRFCQCVWRLAQVANHVANMPIAYNFDPI